jgi:uncharacterized membrane protein
MILAAILISSREWLLPAIVFLLITSALLVWTYLRAPANKPVRTFCALLKILGIAALLMCLLEPLWSSQRAKPGSNYFAVVADNSEGMKIKDRGDTQTRGDSLTNLVSPKSKWIAALENNFQARRYVFDSRLQSTKDFSELVFDGRASAIGAALHSVAERFRGQPLAGVLLLTDGNATDLPDATGLPPIFPVVVGRDDPIADIAIQKVAVSQTIFEDTPVTVQADVSAEGYSGRTLIAQLLDQSGKVAQELTQRAGRNVEAFRFQLKPEKPGVSFYRLRVSAKDELGQFTKPETSVEATLANNTRVVTVDRGQGAHRILYVGGRPNWEFKFMNRALAEDNQIQLVTLMRIARREPKFDFRGRIGETSNPLYRGFDNKTEETERYDQPVLVRMNTKDSTELAGGFPKTAEELFAYEAVVLDRVEAEFFTRDQMSLLQKFVSERGGGFLMLGGAESFHQGNYDHTPIGEMLPVYLDFAPEPKLLTNLTFSLTREGWLQPWARVHDNEVDEKRRLSEMPGLQVLNPVRSVKPGASVIAEVQDEIGAKHPALVTQRFGNGRTTALLIGDLWRWGFQDEAKHKEMDKTWRQLFRALIADVPARIDFRAEPKRDDPNQAMSLAVRVRDKQFKALDNATVKISVTPIGEAATNVVHLNGEAAANEAGFYEATYVPRATGGYLAEAVATDAEGVEVGRAQVGWSSDPSAEEFKSLKPNRALLENLARQTGGEVIAANNLESFARSLPNRKAPVMETETTPLWHQPAVFLFALGCFVVEWGVRRWKGLA